jgi:hypothetical protein
MGLVDSSLGYIIATASTGGLYVIATNHLLPYLSLRSCRAPIVVWSKQLSIPGVQTGPVYTIEETLTVDGVKAALIYLCGTATKTNGKEIAEG